MRINPNLPSMTGLTLLGEEFAARVVLPIKRAEIDWAKVLYDNFGWEAHLIQRKVLTAAFEKMVKVIFIRAGKRSGKTQTAIALARTILTEVPGARGWCAAGTYDLSDRVFDPLWNDAMIGKFGKVSDRSKKDRRIRFEGGGLLQGKSWEDAESLEGESLDFAIADEGQTLDEERFNRLIARTLDRGGILFVIGSAMSDDDWFLGKAEWAKMTPDCAYFEWTVEDNPYQSQEELERLRNLLDEESYNELFRNEVRQPEGLVFSGYFDPMYNVHDREPDSRIPMQVWIDPGTTVSAYAVGFAQCMENGDVYLYDEVYEHMLESESVIDITRNNQYWHMVEFGVMDVAGRQHHDNKFSPKEIWTRKAKISIHDRRVEIDAGIQVHKAMLLQKSTGRRRLFIHKRMENTLREYRTYKYPKRTGSMSEPKHPIDAFNHMMKAISYGIVHNFDYFDRKKKSSIKSWFMD